MYNDFLSYDLSLAMKELGFDEFSLGWYMKDTSLLRIQPQGIQCTGDDVTAPTYQQVFDWFCDKHNLYHQILKGYGWEGIVRNARTGDIEWHDGTFNSPKEAQIACIEEMIKVIESKENGESEDPGTDVSIEMGR
jgi:hypothetical protein